MDSNTIQQIIRTENDNLIKRLAMRERAATKADPNIVSYHEAGRRLGKTYGAIKKMVQRRQLRKVSPPGERRSYIPVQEIDDYVARCR